MPSLYSVQVHGVLCAHEKFAVVIFASKQTKHGTDTGVFTHWVTCLFMHL